MVFFTHLPCLFFLSCLSKPIDIVFYVPMEMDTDTFVSSVLYSLALKGKKKKKFIFFLSQKKERKKEANMDQSGKADSTQKKAQVTSVAVAAAVAGSFDADILPGMAMTTGSGSLVGPEHPIFGAPIIGGIRGARSDPVGPIGPSQIGPGGRRMLPPPPRDIRGDRRDFGDALRPPGFDNEKDLSEF